MSLLIRARIKAARHSFEHLGDPDHRIWRLYSHFGFKTDLVICECGKEFGRSPRCSAVLNSYGMNESADLASRIRRR